MLNKFKHKFHFKIFKKINHFINSLFKNYLNKLNFNSLFSIAKSNNFFFTFVALTILFLSYVSIPSIYNKTEIHKELKVQLLNKLSLNFNFSQNLKYSFFPRPHFISENSSIFKDQNKISDIKKLKIYVSLKNLFSLENIEVKEIILNNANFNLNNQTYDFFTKLLKENFKDSSLTIKDSNVFYRNVNNEVLFINKIRNTKYYYNTKNFANMLISKNEIFNLPYSLVLYDDKIKKIMYLKINSKFLKSQIENEIDYNTNVIKGSSNLIFNNNKVNSNYEIKKESLNFSLFNKVNSDNYSYKGKMNFNPFYSSLKGKVKKIDLDYLLNSSSLIPQLLKTEIFNNKNLDFHVNIVGNEIYNNENFINIFFSSRIQEGLIDLDNTNFFWNNHADFKISNSLIFVENGELILDGKLDIAISNSKEVYKFLLTPRNYRREFKKIELNFIYNFDQKILSFNDIKIDNIINQKFNENLKKLVFNNDKLQNKIYFKNKINKAIKAYAG